MRLGATEVDTPSRAGWKRGGVESLPAPPHLTFTHQSTRMDPMMDTKLYERHAKKILDVFSDGRLTNLDLIYVAFYTVLHAYPFDPVLDRVIEFAEHVKVERERFERNKDYGQDTLF